MSRKRLQDLIKQNLVCKNEIPFTDASAKVKAGELYTITVPAAIAAIPEPQLIPIEILHEDDDVIVINKAAGMVVHPAPGNYDQTLFNALLAHCGDRLSGIGGVIRPGIVHRLDKQTSGLMVVAKNDYAHRFLSEQFAKQGDKKTLERTYVALVWGVPQPLTGTITTLIGRDQRNRQKMAVVKAISGKTAVTHYKCKQSFVPESRPKDAISLVKCVLGTGRTHQIRVHLNFLGFPVVGDPTYGRKSFPKSLEKVWPKEVLEFPRQALHAVTLIFIHPRSEEQMYFTTELPEDLENLLEIIQEFN